MLTNLLQMQGHNILIVWSIFKRLQGQLYSFNLPCSNGSNSFKVITTQASSNSNKVRDKVSSLVSALWQEFLRIRNQFRNQISIWKSEINLEIRNQLGNQKSKVRNQKSSQKSESWWFQISYAIFEGVVPLGYQSMKKVGHMITVSFSCTMFMFSWVIFSF